MNKIKKIILIIFTINFATQVYAKDIPGSFADLPERLIPSVVIISPNLEKFSFVIFFGVIVNFIKVLYQKF